MKQSSSFSGNGIIMEFDTTEADVTLVAKGDSKVVIKLIKHSQFKAASVINPTVSFL